ncbi:MAG: hypothetical protein LBV27_10345 [Oscillospiraceae bacterium]|nr:hypothetical protein [Oscillospiraceae bacterium]
MLKENYYDIMQNAENELMFCVKVRDGEPDRPYIEYDGGANALFYRRPGQVILLDEVHADARKSILTAEEILFAEFIPKGEQAKPEDGGVIREYMVAVRKVEKLPDFDTDEPQKTGKQILRVSYDFIDNGDGELMLVMDAPEGSPDDETAKFVYDGFTEAMLVRNDSQIIHLPVISEPIRDMLSGLETVMVSEMNGEEISDVYEAQIEIQDGALPIA